MKTKTILANVTVIIISLCVFISGYARTLELPIYADSTTDEWTQVTTNEQLVEAFRYYCKSRDVTIEGSVADAVTSFTTKTFNGLVNTLGLDVNVLQANLKYQTDGNLGIRFLFNTLSIDAYNRIFAQFLQDNEVEVGDKVNDKVVYSNEWFEDNNGNGCFVYVINSNYDGEANVNRVNKLLAIGTPYYFSSVYDFATYLDLSKRYWGQLSVSAGVTNYTYAFYVDYNSNNQYSYVRDTELNDSTYVIDYFSFISSNSSSLGARKGTPVIWKRGNTYYFGAFSESINKDQFSYHLKKQINFGSKPLPSVTNIYITTNNNVINNNNYEGDTIINNNGTTGDGDDGGDDNPSPITPPGTIGGNGSDGTINFPDFNFNLPEINWSLGDLSNKFPFSIPFDMIAFLGLLNGEPTAPHITGSIPLTSHYTWELDLDFSQFDTFASIMRGLEFVGFLFFLISATINIVRG